MDVSTHSARIVGPVSYQSDSGKLQSIPTGPCLVETLNGRLIDIIWGAYGQNSVALPIEAIRAAHDDGHLILLD